MPSRPVKRQASSRSRAVVLWSEAVIKTRSYESTLPLATVARYRWLETRYAALVLASLAPAESADLVAALDGFAMDVDLDIGEAGGNESKAAARLNKVFRDRGWREGNVRWTVGEIQRRQREGWTWPDPRFWPPPRPGTKEGVPAPVRATAPTRSGRSRRG